MRTLLSLLVIALVLGLGSCKKDKDPVNCSAAWATEIEAELNAYMDALMAYMGDQSVANCNAYKDASQDYINAMEPFLNCSALTAAERQELQDAIDESQAAMDALNCSAK